MVTVTVNGGSGNPTPTGSVTLTSGTYASGAVTLSGGSAMINIPAGSLAVGMDTLTANYTPDSGRRLKLRQRHGIEHGHGHQRRGRKSWRLCEHEQFDLQLRGGDQRLC
jgi:hypothetical protein